MTRNTRPKLIGLSGYAGSGKDTACNALMANGYASLAFADPMRRMLRELLLCSVGDDSYMDFRKLKEHEIPGLGVSYRHLAQTLGTEWGRALGQDFWIRIAEATISQRLRMAGDKPMNFVVSDVRFANEAAWIREQGGVIWRIERASTVPVRAHVSEQELYLFHADDVLQNDGSINDLYHLICRKLDAPRIDV